MSTIKEILERVDRNKPNAFGVEKKMRWVAELDGKIALQVFLMSYADAVQLQYQYPQDLDREPLVTFPHEDIYDAWLECKIDLQNGETDKYQNAKVVFDALYNDFVNWFCNNYDPGNGDGANVVGNQNGVPVYYITAYGLAVRQGFAGTLDEWLAALKGEKGDKGDPGAKLSIGTVRTLPAGRDATAEITGTAENPVLNLGIPRDTGDALLKAGGVMAGPIDMNGHAISGLEDPDSDDKPVTLGFFNSFVSRFRGSVNHIDPDSAETAEGFYSIDDGAEIYGVTDGFLWHKEVVPGLPIQLLVSSDVSLIWIRSYCDGAWSPRRQLGFGFGAEADLPETAQDGQLFFVKQ